MLCVLNVLFHMPRLQYKSPHLLRMCNVYPPLRIKDMDTASCRYQKAVSFPHALPMTTPEHHLSGSHHQ